VQNLHKSAVLSRAELDAAKRDFDVTEVRYTEARRDEEFVKSPPLAEDVAKAEAEVEAARQQVTVAGQRMSRCEVAAPITGTVLRVRMRVGEIFSTMAPTPLFEMADVSTKRVRAEGDEKDVARIRMGQTVWVSTDTDQENRFPGKVTSISGIMGRRKILTGDPADKSDRDVLEVVVEVGKRGELLPVGLRVVPSIPTLVLLRTSPGECLVHRHRYCSASKSLIESRLVARRASSLGPVSGLACD